MQARIPRFRTEITQGTMRLLPYLFQFLSGRNSKSETEVAITREAPKTYRQSVRLLIVEVRSPGDQQHFVAIPPCAGRECRESQVQNARY
jgi:hypothetical protein